METIPERNKNHFNLLLTASCLVRIKPNSDLQSDTIEMRQVASLYHPFAIATCNLLLRMGGMQYLVVYHN